MNVWTEKKKASASSTRSVSTVSERLSITSSTAKVKHSTRYVSTLTTQNIFQPVCSINVNGLGRKRSRLVRTLGACRCLCTHFMSHGRLSLFLGAVGCSPTVCREAGIRCTLKRDRHPTTAHAEAEASSEASR